MGHHDNMTMLHLTPHLILYFRGLNPVYDCFPCQIFTIGKNFSVSSLHVIMDYQVRTVNCNTRNPPAGVSATELMLLCQVERVSGEILDKSVMEEITQSNPDKQGFLQMSGIQNGLFHSEEWRVLEINQNFMIGQCFSHAYF